MSRTWREPQENPVDPVPGGAEGYAKYMSYQKLINSNNGEIDETLLEEHINNELYANEKYTWNEIPVDFSLINLGDRVRYTTYTPEGKHLFRTGGWVIALDEGHKWLVYLAHTRTSWSLQAEDCQRLFITRRKPKKIKKITFKRPGLETKHNAYLIKNNEQIRVASFDTKWLLNRFLATNKYKRASESEDWVFK